MRHIKNWAGFIAFGVLMAGASIPAMASTFINGSTINATVTLVSSEPAGGGETEYDYKITNNSGTKGITQFTLNAGNLVGIGNSGTGIAPSSEVIGGGQATWIFTFPGITSGKSSDTLTIFSTSSTTSLQDATVVSSGSTIATNTLPSPVPVPATMAILLSGLPCVGAFGFFANRRKTALS